MVKILALSTSQSRAGVAWSDGDEFRSSVFPAAKTGELLREQVEPLLQLGVERLAVDIGPGSYTGTRVGVAFVQGMAIALSVPWVGIPAWQILDRIAPESTVIITASRRGEVLVRNHNGQVLALPLSETGDVPFGFPCSNPEMYGGVANGNYLIPGFEQYLSALITIAGEGESLPGLPVYFDRFTTDSAKKQ